MELVKPVEPVLWASIVELVIGGTGYGTVEALQSGMPTLKTPYLRAKLCVQGLGFQEIKI